MSRYGSLREWRSSILRDYERWIDFVLVSVDETLIVTGKTEYIVGVLKMRDAERENSASEVQSCLVCCVLQSVDGTPMYLDAMI